MAGHFDLFVSYARSDHEQVAAIVDGLSARGITTWWDRQELRAGELWQDQILDGLRHARAILAFLSEASIDSPWFMAEIEGALEHGAGILPVLLPGTRIEALPAKILQYQILDMNAFAQSSAVDSAVAEILRLLDRIDGNEQGIGLDDGQLQGFARVSAAESGAVPEPAVGEGGGGDGVEPPHSVFMVHGHDEDMLDTVRNFLLSVGVQPIVLRDEATEHTSLIQKFMDHGKKAKFAIVLVSADDIGAGLFQYDDPEVSDRALQFRARQNVILELGFFYGLLHFQHVFVLERKSQRNFPNFEWPSDLLGMPFNRLDDDKTWQGLLTDKLKKRGFNVEPQND